MLLHDSPCSNLFVVLPIQSVNLSSNGKIEIMPQNDQDVWWLFCYQLECCTLINRYMLAINLCRKKVQRRGVGRISFRDVHTFSVWWLNTANWPPKMNDLRSRHDTISARTTRKSKLTTRADNNKPLSRFKQRTRESSSAIWLRDGTFDLTSL